MTKEKKQWSSQEEMVRMVDELKAEGMTAKDACAKVGVNFTHYYRARREQGLGRKPSGTMEQLMAENAALWGLVNTLRKERG